MCIFKITVAVAAFSLPASISYGEVSFPKTRNLVGPGEYYLLAEFDDWRAECIRDADGEDTCEAATTITDLDAGLELDFAVFPYVFAATPPEFDVDITPRAIVQIIPYSSSEHYSNYSAAITEVDGEPFDGFWCHLDEPD